MRTSDESVISRPIPSVSNLAPYLVPYFFTNLLFDAPQLGYPQTMILLHQDRSTPCGDVRLTTIERGHAV